MMSASVLLSRADYERRGKCADGAHADAPIVQFCARESMDERPHRGM
jgi:hypothetical protein